jgi:hypothetical protein
MRWLAVWLLLTGVYFAGQIAALLFTGGAYTRESLAHLAIVPLAQVAALWLVTAARRHSRRPPQRAAGREGEPPSR